MGLKLRFAFLAFMLTLPICVSVPFAFIYINMFPLSFLFIMIGFAISLPWSYAWVTLLRKKYGNMDKFLLGER